MQRLTTLAVAALLAACGREAPLTPEPPPELLIGSSPLAIEYIKVETDAGSGAWTGRVYGDVTGRLQTEALEVTVHRDAWELRTRWQVFGTEGSPSFDAEMSGTLDLQTGALRLSGHVLNGDLRGAAVSNHGRLTGVDPLTGGTVFEGSLRIVPPSGN